MIVVLVAALFAGVGADVIWRGAQRRHVAAAVVAIAAVVGLVALDVVDTVDRRSAVIWAVTAAVAMALLIANSCGPLESGGPWNRRRDPRARRRWS